MAQYINKAAVMAEIKGLIRANEIYLSEPETDEVRFQKTGAYSVLNDLLHSLDTLEVKEVGLDLGNPDGDMGVKTVWDGDKIVSSKTQKGG